MSVAASAANTKPFVGFSENMIADLLETLTNSRRVEPQHIESRCSRKMKRVTVTICIDEMPIEFSISMKRLDKAIDRVCSFSDGSGPLTTLWEELLHARQEYGHFIDGVKKSRGIQSGRKGTLYDQKPPTSVNKDSNKLFQAQEHTGKQRGDLRSQVIEAYRSGCTNCPRIQ